MSPSDSPDFDNMSPEEMMRWMETLAKRQGADNSGFTTDASADVVDPTDYDEKDFGPGYTPYGEKKAEPAQAQQSKPEPEPEPEVQPPAIDAGGLPDFETMSAEEAMRWMETLAKRQGADVSGFTTDASADVVDPTDYDERDFGPGYTPYGEKKAEPAQAKQPEPEPEPEPVQDDDDMSWLDNLAGGISTADASDLPDLGDLDSLTAELDDVLGDTQPQEAGIDPISWLDDLASSQPEPPVTSKPPAAEQVTPPETSLEDDMDPLGAGIDPMTWLESLAKKQGANPEELLTTADMDIPDTPETEGANMGPGYSSYDVDDEGQSEPAVAIDTSDWLNNLADDSTPQNFLGDVDLEDEDELDAVDPASWLGDLANDPDVASRIPGFDPNPAPRNQESQASTGDPIADMLNRGETPDPESMQAWMLGKMGELEEMNKNPHPIREEDDEETAFMFDPDAPAVQGELPDWVQDVVQVYDDEDDAATAAAEDEDMSDLEALFMQSGGGFNDDDESTLPDFLTGVDAEDDAEGEPSPLSDEISPPDMPDWLMEDIPSEGDSLDSVFAQFETTETEQAIPTKNPIGELDPELVARLNPEGQAEYDDDPWVDALNDETDSDNTMLTPEWYEQAINDPERRKGVADLAGSQLEPVEFPEETHLPSGQREPLPDWLALATGSAPAVVAEADGGDDIPDWLAPSDAEGDDLPNWLSDTDEAEEEMPAWLLETLDDEPNAFPVVPSSVDEPEPEPTPAPPARREPEPEPSRSPVAVPSFAQIDVAAALQEARSEVQRGDIERGLMAYESVIRANEQLEAVVADVSNIIKADKENAPAYRVLGDALMRQGKLQAALDTYRRALNML